jgi:hypothetical protein
LRNFELPPNVPHHDRAHLGKDVTAITKTKDSVRKVNYRQAIGDRIIRETHAESKKVRIASLPINSRTFRNYPKLSEKNRLPLFITNYLIPLIKL